MPKETVTYFAVGSAEGLRSSIWRVWIHKNDVYLLALGGVQKVSLHESGRWQLSLTSEYVRKMQAKGQWPLITRHMDRWHRPVEMGPGLTLAFRILIPTSELRLMKTRSSKPINWITPAPIGHWMEIAILFIAPGRKFTGWLGQRAMKTELLSHGVLPNGQILSLVYRRELVPPELQIRIDRHRSSLRKQFRGIDWRDPTLRKLILGTHADGSRYLIELAMDTGTRDAALE